MRGQSSVMAAAHKTYLVKQNLDSGGCPRLSHSSVSSDFDSELLSSSSRLPRAFTSLHLSEGGGQCFM